MCLTPLVQLINRLNPGRGCRHIPDHSLFQGVRTDDRSATPAARAGQRRHNGGMDRRSSRASVGLKDDSFWRRFERHIALHRESFFGLSRRARFGHFDGPSRRTMLARYPHIEVDDRAIFRQSGQNVGQR